MSTPHTPPRALRARSFASGGTPTSPGPRQPSSLSDRGGSPAPSPPRGRRSVENTSPRAWLKSPTSSTVPAFMRLALVLANDDGSMTPTADSSERGSATIASPLVSTAEQEDKTFTVETHRGAGGVPFSADHVFNVSSLDDVGEVLDVLPYQVADSVAEGFHAALLCASPTTAEDAISMLIDSDEGDARLLTVTMGYVLDLFQRDSVAIDLCAVSISAETGLVVDLLAPPSADSFIVENLQYRSKWGLCGGCRTVSINSIDDVAGLPTAGAVAAASGGDTSAVVIFQFRLRRVQTVQLPRSSGEFDVVQHVSFIGLPPGPWCVGSGSAFGVTDAGSPKDAADAVVTSLTGNAPGTGVMSREPSRSGGGEAPESDDSTRFMAQQVLSAVMREVCAGSTVSTTVLPTTTTMLATLSEVSAAARDFDRLRTLTQRLIVPAGAAEIAALREAEAARSEAIAAAKTLVRFVDEPAVLVDRDTWSIEATNAAADRFLPEQVILMELCRAGADDGVLSSAEVMDVMEACGTSAADVSTPSVHLKGDDTRVLSHCDAIGMHLLLIRFVAKREVSEAVATNGDDAKRRVEEPPVVATGSESPGEESEGPAARDEAAATHSTRLERQHAAKRRLVEERRAQTQQTNKESSCSCIVA